jgi:hypothetical protein
MGGPSPTCQFDAQPIMSTASEEIAYLLAAVAHARHVPRLTGARCSAPALTLSSPDLEEPK